MRDQVQGSGDQGIPGRYVGRGEQRMLAEERRCAFCSCKVVAFYRVGKGGKPVDEMPRLREFGRRAEHTAERCDELRAYNLVPGPLNPEPSAGGERHV